MKTKLVGVIGSLGQESSTRTGIQYVLKSAERLGAEVQVIDLRSEGLPVFNPDDRNVPGYDGVKKKVLWANAILLGSPDYHGSMSGAMKNFLDYFWKEFAGKVFGYLCASHEKGLTAMDQMRTAVRQCYGWSLPYGVSVTDGDFDTASGKAIHPKIADRLDNLAYDLAIYASVLQKQFQADISSPQEKAGFATHYRVKSTS